MIKDKDLKKAQKILWNHTVILSGACTSELNKGKLKEAKRHAKAFDIVHKKWLEVFFRLDELDD